MFNYEEDVSKLQWKICLSFSLFCRLLSWSTRRQWSLLNFFLASDSSASQRNSPEDVAAHKRAVKCIQVNKKRRLLRTPIHLKRLVSLAFFNVQGTGVVLFSFCAFQRSSFFLDSWCASFLRCSLVFVYLRSVVWSSWWPTANSFRRNLFRNLPR